MKATSELYKTLLSETGAFYDVEVICGNKTYTSADIRTLTITQSLFTNKGPAIGGTVSAECKLDLKEESENWPRMASFEVRTRLSSADETRKSEWLSFGTFYTDERSKTQYGFLSITAFDGILKLEQSWSDKVASSSLPKAWPVTARKMCELITEATGVQVENLSEIDNNAPFIGLNTGSTAREMFQLIASGLGGNWRMTEDGNMKLCFFQSDGAVSSAIAGIAIAGLAVVGTVGASGGTTGTVMIRERMKQLDYSPALDTITGVELTAPDGTVASAGNDIGYVLKAECDFSDASAVASVCLGNIPNDYEYRPFEATCAVLDASVELGDFLYASGETYQIFGIDWTLGRHITANLKAEYDEEVDHEYTITSESAKTLKKAVTAAERAADKSIQEFIDGDFKTALGEIENQIDKKADIWYQATDPATGWTASEKAEHVGDLWYDTTNSATWMYAYSEDNGYEWINQFVPDAVFEEIDGEINKKAQIFVGTPTPPYNVGDLWFNSSYEGILTCITARAEGESFSTSDWQERNKYTDDSAATAVQNNLNALESEYRAYKTEIEQTVSDVTVSVTQIDDNLSELETHYRFDADGEWIGKSNSEKIVRLSNEGIDMMVHDEVVTRYTQDEALLPLKVNVPLGGSLQLGDFIWNPRSSGNLSLMWVGD